MISFTKMTGFVLLSLVLASSSASFAQSDADRRYAQLNQIYASHERAGRYADAEKTALQVLALVRRFSRPKLEAAWLKRLGAMQSILGKLEESQKSLNQALTLARRHSGPKSVDVADLLVNLSNVIAAKGQHSESEQMLREAIPIYENALSNHRNSKEKNYFLDGLVVCFGNLGAVCQDLGKYEEAEKMYQRSLELTGRMNPVDRFRVASGYQNLGAFYHLTGRLRDAESAARKSLEIYEEQLGAGHEKVAGNLNNLANILADQGDIEGAIDLLQTSYSICRKTFGLNHIRTLNVLENLGSKHCLLGHYSDAEVFFKRALSLTEEHIGHDHPKLISRLDWLASVEDIFGRLDEAIRLAERSLRISESKLGPTHPKITYSLTTLSVFYMKKKRYEDAERMARRAIEVCEKNTGNRDVRTAHSHRALAYVYSEQKKFEKAAQHQERQLEITSELYGDNLFVANALGGLAETRLELKQFGDAEALANRALAIYKKINHLDGLNYAHFLRAKIRHEQGSDEALNDLLAAMRFAESQRGNLGGDEHGRSAGFAGYNKTYALMVRWQSESGNVAEAFSAIERSRARGLQDLMAVQGVDLLRGMPEVQADELRHRESDALAAIAEWEQRLKVLAERENLSDVQREKMRKEFEEQLKKARDEYVDAYAAIRRASPAYQMALSSGNKPVELSEIETLVTKQNAMLLQYFLGEKQAYVLSVSPRGSELSTIRLDQEQAEQLTAEKGPLSADKLNAILSNSDNNGVMQLLRRSEDPAVSNELTPKLSALWRLLVPVDLRQQILSGALDRLIVIPDGALSTLPFEALVVEEDEEPVYALDVAPPIQYAPSATILNNLAKRNLKPTKDVRSPVLTVGDPDYQSRSTANSDSTTPGARYSRLRGKLQQLPYSGLEAKWVSQVFDKQGIKTGQFIGAKATELNVTHSLPGRRIVHLACHGLMDPSHGNLFGALALTPGSGTKSSNDGYLTLGEIYDLDMQGCELTILSACDTNFGPAQKGEGVWALSRGFLVAGSRRVVASNWFVDDRAAASLISYYCSGIAKAEGNGEKADYAEKLHKAKKWVRDQQQWWSPYYWATFVLVGPN